MTKYFLPQPHRMRQIEESFTWIDHRLHLSGLAEAPASCQPTSLWAGRNAGTDCPWSG